MLPRALAEGGGRESPGVRVTFFRVAERKSPKKGRPPVCDPFAVRRGDLRRVGCGVRRGTHFALRATFRQPRRARQRGMGALAPMLTPQPPRRRRSQQGCGQPNNQQPTAKQPNSQTATRAIASLGPACAARRACAREAGPSAATARRAVGSPAPLYAPRSAVGGVACVPKDTQASWTSSSQLFERSCIAAQ